MSINHWCRRLGNALLLAIAGGATLIWADEPPLPPATEKSIDFCRDVYPILKERCFQCHQGAEAESGHRLDVRSEITGESTGVPLLEVGNSRESRLIQLVAGLDAEKRMPPEGERLSAEQIGTLRAWIDQGLKWNDTLLPPLEVSSDHWAFQSLSRPPPAERDPSGWSRGMIDEYIALEHRRRKFAPARKLTAARSSAGCPWT